MPIATIEGSENCADTPPEARAARAVAIETGRIALLHNAGRESHPLCARANALATGMNGGYQMLNILWHAGAARVVLLGYSMRPAPEQHVHPKKSSPSIYTAMLNEFRKLAAALPRGFEVINATRESALNCFPRAPLARLLSDSQGAALPG